MSDLIVLNTDSNNIIDKNLTQINLAQNLHHSRTIYLAYGIVDGFNISYSTLKYIFDMHYSNTSIISTDQLHTWLLTPWGLLIAIGQSILMTVFSMLAHYFQDNDSNKITRYFSKIWPYLRDMFKALKNAYKSTLGIVNLLNTVNHQNLNFIILPIAITLGILSTFNRWWYRYMINDRKNITENNKYQLLAMLHITTLSSAQKQNFLTYIEQQETFLRHNTDNSFNFVSAICSGLFDSIYYYFSVFALTKFSSMLFFISMLTFNSIFTLICIATRIYEEYAFQQQLYISQFKIRMLLESQQSHQEIKKFIDLLSITPDVIDLSQNAKIINNIENLYLKLMQKQLELQQLLIPTNMQACLIGLRDGLASYAAISSAVSAIAIICSLASISFPPLLFLITSVIGLLVLGLFAINSVITNRNYRNDQLQRHQEMQDHIKIWIDYLYNSDQQNKSIINHKNIAQHLEVALHDSLNLDYPKILKFQDSSEVMRSGCTGIGKGFKAVDYALNSLQTIGQDSHYHNTSIMMIFSVISAIIHSIIYALRAYARGFNNKLNTTSTVRIHALNIICKFYDGPLQNDNTKTAPHTLSTTADDGGDLSSPSDFNDDEISSLTVIQDNKSTFFYPKNHYQNQIVLRPNTAYIGH